MHIYKNSGQVILISTFNVYNIIPNAFVTSKFVPYIHCLQKFQCSCCKLLPFKTSKKMRNVTLKYSVLQVNLLFKMNNFPLKEIANGKGTDEYNILKVIIVFCIKNGYDSEYFNFRLIVNYFLL